ncbi:MAG: metal-dependent hydrolase [Parcubacteria group bacterium]
MRGSTHAVIGANMVWIPILMGSVVEPWLFLVGAFTALLPDLDASESKIKHLKLSGYIGKTKVTIKPFAPIAMVVSTIFGHRGALHSLVAIAVVAAGASFLIPYTSVTLWLVATLGYASHLLADASTKSGIEIFWPWKENYGILPRFLRVRTSGIVDTLLLLAGSAGVVVFLYQYVESFTL